MGESLRDLNDLRQIDESMAAAGKGAANKILVKFVVVGGCAWLDFLPC